MTDEELIRALDPLRSVGSGIVELPGWDEAIFVKLIPITQIEIDRPGCTANLFGLPVNYQYRLGSHGFGAWRELWVHERVNPPRLFDSRVLPVASARSFEIGPFTGSDAVRRRIDALQAATSSLVLFIEALPATLSTWFARQEQMPDLERIEYELLSLVGDFNERGILHMDTHFDNIMTDGQRLVLSDFGLALSSSFELNSEEREFFDRHRGFDRATVITSLAHAVVQRHDDRVEWRAAFYELCRSPRVASRVRTWLQKRRSVVEATGRFYQHLLERPWDRPPVPGL